MQCKHNLLQRKVDSTVNEVQQIKDGLKSLNERVLSGSQIEEKLQSLAELIEQKVDQNQSYISEVHMSKSYFEQEYAGIISVNQTQISEIKNVVDQLQEKIERIETHLDDTSNDRSPPNGIPTPFESLRFKLDQLVDSLVPKEVSVKRHTQVYEGRKERSASIHKKPRPKSELFNSTETPILIRSSSLSSATSSGYTSLPHQDSGELSLLSSQVPIGETDKRSHPKSKLFEFISLEAAGKLSRSVSTESSYSNISSGYTSLLPQNTESGEMLMPLDLSPSVETSPLPVIITSEVDSMDSESCEKVPENTHVILQVAWAMGDLLESLNILSMSLIQQKRDELDNEK